MQQGFQMGVIVTQAVVAAAAGTGGIYMFFSLKSRFWLTPAWVLVSRDELFSDPAGYTAYFFPALWAERGNSVNWVWLGSEFGP